MPVGTRQKKRAKVPAFAIPARGSDATRARILEAAKVLFSQNSYEGAGVREIASQAEADPALVIRYFGSKEGLFRAVAEQAFRGADLLAGNVGALPQQATKLLMGRMDAEAWRTGYDPLRLLLCSIGSNTAGPILGQYQQQDFVLPLALALGGKQSRERAAMVCAQIVGFALVRIALNSDERHTLQRAAMRRFVHDALARLVCPERA